jgi:hypothetical protein
MKTMTVFEARNQFAKTLKAAKKDLIIVHPQRTASGGDPSDRRR